MSLEKEFRQWMGNLAKTRGSGMYAKGTVEAYSNHLKNATSKLQANVKHMNIFLYTSLKDFLPDYEIILAAPNFKEIDDKAGNKAFSNGLKRYKEFLEAREHGENKFLWVETFKKISDWLSNYENKQDELIQILNNLGVGNKDLTMIDPFSFLGQFLKYSKNYSQYINNLLAQESIDAPNIYSNDGLPSADPNNSYYFPIQKPEDDDIECLWQLFHEARNKNINEETFEKALGIKHVGFAKLTQALFWICPNDYFPVDKKTTPWLKKHNFPVPAAFNGYVALLPMLRNTGKTMYEISHEAYVEETNTKNGDIMNFPLNQILYGPPGTGKTYNTVELAVRIIEGKSAPDNWEELKMRYDEYVKQKQITMVTFHQSYSYEDFVEGISASAKDGNIFYEPKNGIFKEICEYASATNLSLKSNGYDIIGKRIWKMSLGDASKQEDEQIYDDCINKGYITLGYGDEVDFRGCTTEEMLKERYYKKYNRQLPTDPLRFVKYMVVEMKPGDVVIVSKGNKMFRAIGKITGDYEFNSEATQDPDYAHCRKVEWLKVFEGGQPRELIFDKNIIQKTLYDAEQSINRERLAKFLSTPVEKKPYVLIIDEINRGNVSRIFGELITLIEDSKRKGMLDERSITLPYTQEQFFVPDNLYIIGTMNTADRSLTSIDLALRRRFTFIETPSLPNKLENIIVHGVNMAHLLNAINTRIEALIDKDHCIGHCYFLSLENANDKESMLAKIFENKILPLLQEYFYGDWETIKKVLNGQFVIEKTVNLMGDVATVYHINKAAYSDPNSYIEISKL